jgi:hypothetical protein
LFSIGQRWGLAGMGWESVQASSLATTVAAVSPMMVLLFAGVMLRRWGDPSLTVAKVFLLSTFTYVALLQDVVPYRPYYDRYLVSEFVPRSTPFKGPACPHRS